MNLQSLQPRDYRRPPTTWQGLLEGAGSEPELVSIVRDFDASFSIDELESIPTMLRPRKVSDSEDVANYAFELIRYRLHQGEATPPVVARFADFYARASIRMSQIAWRHRLPDYLSDDAA